MTNEVFLASITLDGEKWKDVPNYEGYYCVSTKGRVVSLGRCIDTIGGKRNMPPKLLTPKSAGNTGYYRVNLRKNGKTSTVTVHRLVATTFIPNPSNKSEIDHIDTDKTNNNVENLRWCTPKENMRNPLTMQLMRRLVYDNIPKHKRCVRPVASIKDGNISKIYPSLKSVAEDGHNPDCVWNCCNGVNKIHNGFEWRYMTAHKLLSNQ